MYIKGSTYFLTEERRWRHFCWIFAKESGFGMAVAVGLPNRKVLVVKIFPAYPTNKFSSLENWINHKDIYKTNINCEYFLHTSSLKKEDEETFDLYLQMKYSRHQSNMKQFWEPSRQEAWTPLCVIMNSLNFYHKRFNFQFSFKKKRLKLTGKRTTESKQCFLYLRTLKSAAR